MPTHIFYNSLTQIPDEDNFKYDFYVSKSPSDGSQLTTTGPFFRLKTDNTGSGIAVGAGSFAYQFTGHGDKVANLNSFQSENMLDVPTRTYSSQILTKLQTSDFGLDGGNPQTANGNNVNYPIFVFGCDASSGFWNKADTGGNGNNSLFIKNIKMTVEIYNPATTGSLNLATYLNNLFTIVAYKNSGDDIITAFPQTYTATKTAATDAANIYGGNANQTATTGTELFNSSFGPVLSSHVSIPFQNKLIINYEADVNKLFTGIRTNTNFKLLLRLNNNVESPITATNLILNNTNMKITSHVTILDQEFEKQSDNF